VDLNARGAFYLNDSLYPACRYFQMIVIPLAKGKDLDNPADTRYQTITRKYEDQVEGKPYITADFKKG